MPVVPDLAALHLDADDAGAFDGDHEVDLVILEVIGDPLAGDDEVAGLELFDERLPDEAFGAVGQPWVSVTLMATGASRGRRLEPEPHVEPSPLCALPLRDVDDAIEGCAGFGGDRGEHFEDAGGFLDDGIVVLSGDELGDFFAQLVAQRCAVFVGGRAWSCAEATSTTDDVGNRVPHEFAQSSLPLA